MTTVEVGPHTPPPVRILPLGDSITEYCCRHDLWTRLVDADYTFDLVGSMAGDPLRDGEPYAWPPYEGLTLDPDHEGHAGWTSGDILTTPGSWDADRGTLYDGLEAYTPDVVLIHLGTNDAFYELDEGVVVENLDEIIRVLRAADPRVRIHLAQIIPLVHPHWNGGTYDVFVQRYNASIAGLAARRTTPDAPILVVDQYTGFDGVEDTYDLIHPDASGDEKVAARWFDSIAADSAPVAHDDAYASEASQLEVSAAEGLLVNDRSLSGSVRGARSATPGGRSAVTG